MYPVSVTFTAAVIAGVLAALAFAAWPWARSRGRFAIAGVATLAGWVAWHLLLNATQASGFDVDAPVIRVSWEDVGSGVATFFFTALALGLVTEREQPAGRVIGTACIVGLVALIFDVFV